MRCNDARGNGANYIDEGLCMASFICIETKGEKMLQAVVLAAGYSSRANTNKLALEIDGIPILSRIVMTLQHVCHDIVVVSGHYNQEVTQLMAGIQSVQVVHNKNYKDGMFSSVKTGMSHIDHDCLLIPGDYPTVNRRTLDQLIEGNGIIRVPIYKGRKGHPIFISKKLVKPLLNHPDTSNLKVFRDLYEVEYIEVQDQGVMMDVDTIEDYQFIKNRVEGC